MGWYESVEEFYYGNKNSSLRPSKFNLDPASLSIVTLFYNQAHFIEDTLDSVRNQTYDHTEHIMMDGGSDDGTVKILEEYEQHDDYDLRWVSEPDDGQSDVINRGFECADGKIVT